MTDHSNPMPWPPDPRTPESTVDDTLLDQYLAGRAADDERAKVRDALRRAPIDAMLVEGMDRLRGTTSDEMATREPVLDDARHRIARRLGAYPHTQTTQQSARQNAQRRARPRKPLRFPTYDSAWIPSWVKITCNVLLFLCVVLFLPRRSSNKPTPAPEPAQYNTNAAQSNTVTLADGTRMTLAPSSSARVMTVNHQRTVVLVGQASFVVTHRRTTPFAVVANSAIMTVLGTEFVVRAYPGEGETRIAVRDGRVSVQSSNTTAANAMVLNASEAASVSATGDVHRLRDGAADAAFAWMHGHLVFRDAPLGTVLPELTRWSGLDLRVADSAMLRYPITTTLPVRLGSDELHAIADAIDARMQRDGRTITFVPVTR